MTGQLSINIGLRTYYLAPDEAGVMAITGYSDSGISDTFPDIAVSYSGDAETAAFDSKWGHLDTAPQIFERELANHGAASPTLVSTELAPGTGVG